MHSNENVEVIEVLTNGSIGMDEADISVLKSPQSVEATMTEREIRSGVPMEFRADAEGEVRVSGCYRAR